MALRSNTRLNFVVSKQPFCMHVDKTMECYVVSTPNVYDFLQPLVKRITAFALIKIKNHLIKGLALDEEGKLEDECSCFTRLCLRLPCKHTLVKIVKLEGCVPLSEVHERWHIIYKSGKGIFIRGFPLFHL